MESVLKVGDRVTHNGYLAIIDRFMFDTAKVMIKFDDGYRVLVEKANVKKVGN